MSQVRRPQPFDGPLNGGRSANLICGRQNPCSSICVRVYVCVRVRSVASATECFPPKKSKEEAPIRSNALGPACSTKNTQNLDGRRAYKIAHRLSGWQNWFNEEAMSNDLVEFNLELRQTTATATAIPVRRRTTTRLSISQKQRYRD